MNAKERLRGAIEAQRYQSGTHALVAVADIAELLDRQEKIADEAEQYRVQLAGCLTAAEGGITDVAKEGDYGWSPAYQKTLELRRAFQEMIDHQSRLSTISLGWWPEQSLPRCSMFKIGWWGW
jgi:hypothetical protein